MFRSPSGLPLGHLASLLADLLVNIDELASFLTEKLLAPNPRKWGRGAEPITSYFRGSRVCTVEFSLTWDRRISQDSLRLSRMEPLLRFQSILNRSENRSDNDLSYIISFHLEVFDLPPPKILEGPLLLLPPNHFTLLAA